VTSPLGAFTGALAAALSTGDDPLEATRIGLRAGAWAVTRAGAQALYPSGRARSRPAVPVALTQVGCR
jgi:ribokinase